MTAAMIRRLEAERMGLSTAALHRRAERTADDAEKRELRTQLADARAALLAMTEDRDHLADALRRGRLAGLMASLIEETGGAGG